MLAEPRRDEKAVPYEFLFLSGLLGLPVVDEATSQPLGKLLDLAGEPTGAYPSVTGLLVKPPRGEPGLLPFSSVKQLDAAGRRVVVSGGALQPPAQGALLFKWAYLDQQIINVAGSRVVRVNDLHFLREGARMWLVHFDVGTRGLLRRLGFLGATQRLLTSMFSYELRDVFIQWKRAQTIDTGTASGAQAIQVPFASLRDTHPADIADILEDLGFDERKQVFARLDDGTAAQTLGEMPEKVRLRLVEELETARLAAIMTRMEADEAADLTQHLSEAKKKELSALIPPEKARELDRLVAFSKRDAGSIMNTAFVTVPEGASMEAVLARIREDRAQAESVYYVYALGAEGQPTGVVTLRNVLAASSQTPVQEVMQRKLVSVTVGTAVRDVARLFLKYDFTVLPVLDEAGKLAGIITLKDALEAVFPKIRREADAQ